MWTEHVVVDIETSPIPHFHDYLGDIRPPSTWKDPEKIQKYLDDAAAKEADKAALDPDLLRIVAAAWRVAGTDDVIGYTASDEANEAKLLRLFWKANANRCLVGYNVLDFDVPALLRRSFYLAVQAPRISVNRYRHDQIVDLMQLLSFDGKLKYRSKEFYMRRLGIPNPDGVRGADVPALIAVGDYASVLAHCKYDVQAEYEIAVRMGVIDAPKSVAPGAATTV